MNNKSKINKKSNYINPLFGYHDKAKRKEEISEKGKNIMDQYLINHIFQYLDSGDSFNLHKASLNTSNNMVIKQTYENYNFNKLLLIINTIILEWDIVTARKGSKYQKNLPEILNLLYHLNLEYLQNNKGKIYTKDIVPVVVHIYSFILNYECDFSNIPEEISLTIENILKTMRKNKWIDFQDNKFQLQVMYQMIKSHSENISDIISKKKTLHSLIALLNIKKWNTYEEFAKFIVSIPFNITVPNSYGFMFMEFIKFLPVWMNNILIKHFIQASIEDSFPLYSLIPCIRNLLKETKSSKYKLKLIENWLNLLYKYKRMITFDQDENNILDYHFDDDTITNEKVVLLQNARNDSDDEEDIYDQIIYKFKFVLECKSHIKILKECLLHHLEKY